MKTRFFTILILLFAFMLNMTECLAQKPANITSGIEWTEKTCNFGKIPQGNPVIAEFHFKNPSMVPLIIFAVNPSCGCTIADYSKEPIQPQKTGVIKVTFDAKDTGYFQKSIAVDTNAEEGSETLIIKGEVIK
ncbi:MAG: DUF1573 domain-containing protein [Bacteroidales bacterium]|nr:DUF1573 domain-containing protein [Bacteroidales bacterium]